jgi:ADP-heptose:LPS heptosyltransferase
LTGIFNFFKNKKRPLRILFILKYGIGDILMQLAYVQEFKKYFADIPMRIYGCYFPKTKKETIDVLLYKKNLFTEVKYFNKKWKMKLNFFKYDFVMDIYEPRVMKAGRRLKQFSTLSNLAEAAFKMPKQTRAQTVKEAINSGKTRIQKSDIGGILGITNETPLEINLPDNQNEIMQKFGLKNKKFITIERCIDVIHKQAESAKLWPVEYCNKLVGIIKKGFPDYQIVQLGPSLERCTAIFGVDINLAGKTSLAELLVLLKYSFLHIGGEGGMVHCRHFLHGGKSVVLFGPTPLKYFAWQENINIKAENACPLGHCIYTGKGSQWQYECMRGFSLGKQPCMLQIIPGTVMSELSRVL